MLHGHFEVGSVSLIIEWHVTLNFIVMTSLIVHYPGMYFGTTFCSINMEWGSTTWGCGSASAFSENLLRWNPVGPKVQLARALGGLQRCDNHTLRAHTSCTTCVVTAQSAASAMDPALHAWSRFSIWSPLKPSILPSDKFPDSLNIRSKSAHRGFPGQSVQPLSHVWLFAIPWTAACQTSLSITNSQTLLKLMSVESVMPSNHFILCRPLLLLP